MMSPPSLVTILCIIVGHVISSVVQANQSVWSPAEEPSYQFNYCNIPREIHGAEGQSVMGYTLRHADLLLTPGQIHVPFDVKGQGQSDPKVTSCDLKFDPSLSEKSNSFGEVSDIYRVVQDDRHGFKDFHPTFSSTCANNHLTSYGLHQMISLGEHLNRAYFRPGSDSKVVPEAARIMVESIPRHSTYQSILSFLHGLLPEKQFTKVKVHKSLDDFCSLSSIETGTCVCHYTADLTSFISRALDQGRLMFKDSVHDVERIRSIMGECTDGQVGGVELFESLMLHQCNNMSSLCQDGNSCCCPSKQQLKQLHHMSSGYLRLLYNDPTFKTFSELHTYPFLSRLVNRSFRSMGDRMRIFMGTRPFLQHLKTSLGVQQQEVMPLGSRFVLEIFQKNWGQIDSGDLYLRTLYNGADVTEQMIGCEELENGLCPMNSFNTSLLLMGEKYKTLC